MQEITESQRPTRWSRTHTIWTVITLSLLPGVIVALFRDEWQQLPTGVRGAAYFTSAVLIVAAFYLIITGGGDSAPAAHEDS